MRSGWREPSFQVRRSPQRGSRVATNTILGQYEFVKKGDPPIVGITKLEGVQTMEWLKRPRMEPLPNMSEPNLATEADRLPASTP